jgi:hypothetical protein
LSDDTTQSTDSTTASGTEPGSETVDSTTTTTPPADQFAEERARLQERIRQEQSRADKAASELEKLKTAATPAAPATPATPATPPTDAPAALTRDEMMALLRRDREMQTAIPALQQEFPEADPAIFNREYDSVEALRAAAETSANSFKARIEQLDLVAKSELEALRQRYVERFGDLGDTPPAQTGAPAAGEPTLAELNSWPLSKWDEYERQHPGVIDRIVNQAQGR